MALVSLIHRLMRAMNSDTEKSLFVDLLMKPMETVSTCASRLTVTWMHRVLLVDNMLTLSSCTNSWLSLGISQFVCRGPLGRARWSFLTVFSICCHGLRQLPQHLLHCAVLSLLRTWLSMLSWRCRCSILRGCPWESHRRCFEQDNMFTFVLHNVFHAYGRQRVL